MVEVKVQRFVIQATIGVYVDGVLCTEAPIAPVTLFPGSPLTLTALDTAICLKVTPEMVDALLTAPVL